MALCTLTPDVGAVTLTAWSASVCIFNLVSEIRHLLNFIYIINPPTKYPLPISTIPFLT